MADDVEASFLGEIQSAYDDEPRAVVMGCHRTRRRVILTRSRDGVDVVRVGDNAVDRVTVKHATALLDAIEWLGQCPPT